VAVPRGRSLRFLKTFSDFETIPQISGEIQLRPFYHFLALFSSPYTTLEVDVSALFTWHLPTYPQDDKNGLLEALWHKPKSRSKKWISDL
jgi:hypothetical protein